MILKHKAELAGRVKLQISGGERGTIDYPWQDNMILDQAFVRLLTTYLAFNHGQQMFFVFGVGSSSQPVQPTDTDLIAPIARNGVYGTQTHGWDEDGGFGWSRNVKTFARGAAAGNISELSTGWSTQANSACARALVRDTSGNPATITVLPDEVLTMTWEMRRWWHVKEPETINYSIDGIPHSTIASYKPIELMNKNDQGLGSGGGGGFVGSILTGSSAQKTMAYSESSGNPEIVSATSPYGIPESQSSPQRGASFPHDPAYVTFTPPIPKTTEFKCDIVWELTLSRRNP